MRAYCRTYRKSQAYCMEKRGDELSSTIEIKDEIDMEAIVLAIIARVGKSMYASVDHKDFSDELRRQWSEKRNDRPYPMHHEKKNSIRSAEV